MICLLFAKPDLLLIEVVLQVVHEVFVLLFSGVDECWWSLSWVFLGALSVSSPLIFEFLFLTAVLTRFVAAWGKGLRAYSLVKYDFLLFDVVKILLLLQTKRAYSLVFLLYQHGTLLRAHHWHNSDFLAFQNELGVLRLSVESALVLLIWESLRHVGINWIQVVHHFLLFFLLKPFVSQFESLKNLYHLVLLLLRRVSLLRVSLGAASNL